MQSLRTTGELKDPSSRRGVRQVLQHSNRTCEGTEVMELRAEAC